MVLDHFVWKFGICLFINIREIVMTLDIKVTISGFNAVHANIMRHLLISS